MEEPTDLAILLLLLLFVLLPFLSPHAYHVPIFNNRPQHVSHVLGCTGMHAGCVCMEHVCVFSIDQVSVVDVETPGQDKLNDAIAPHSRFCANFSDTFLSVINFTSCIVVHIILIYILEQGFYLKAAHEICHTFQAG